jgi:hypothetical protein
MSILDTFWNHPVEQLEKALHIRKQIAALQENLSAILGNHLPSFAAKTPVAEKAAAKSPGRRTLSPAARARIAAAQRARWAKSKGTSAVKVAAVEKAAPAPKGRKKGGISTEGRARIIAAQKARWAKVRAVKGASAPVKAAGKKKRTLSPEARARIVAAVKARWAREKGGKR